MSSKNNYGSPAGRRTPLSLNASKQGGGKSTNDRQEPYRKEVNTTPKRNQHAERKQSGDRTVNSSEAKKSTTTKLGKLFKDDDSKKAFNGTSTNGIKGKDSNTHSKQKDLQKGNEKKKEIGSPDTIKEKKIEGQDNDVNKKLDSKKKDKKESDIKEIPNTVTSDDINDKVDIQSIDSTTKIVKDIEKTNQSKADQDGESPSKLSVNNAAKIEQTEVHNNEQEDMNPEDTQPTETEIKIHDDPVQTNLEAISEVKIDPTPESVAAANEDLDTTLVSNEAQIEKDREQPKPTVDIKAVESAERVEEPSTTSVEEEEVKAVEQVEGKVPLKELNSVAYLVQDVPMIEPEMSQERSQTPTSLLSTSAISTTVPGIAPAAPKEKVGTTFEINDKRPSSQEFITHTSDIKVFPKRLSQITGRRSIRSLGELTPREMPSSREIYRKIDTELDNKDSSLNVTVGSEVPNNESFSFLFSSRKYPLKRECNTDIPVESCGSETKRPKVEWNLSPRFFKRISLFRRTNDQSTPKKITELMDEEDAVEEVSGLPNVDPMTHTEADADTDMPSIFEEDSSETDDKKIDIKTDMDIDTEKHITETKIGADQGSKKKCSIM